MFSLPLRQFERNRAQNARPACMRLAKIPRRATVDLVVAVSRETETHCLNRYPSPKGRTGCPQGRPPQFFLATTGCYTSRQGVAESRTRRSFRFSPGEKPAIPLRTRTITERGTTSCAHPSWSNSRLSPGSAFAPPAATPRSNRPSWAAGQGRPAPSCSTATSLRALWSAPRPTSPIARNTRHAADRSPSLIPARGPLRHIRAIAGSSPRDGVLHARTPGADPGRNDGRDERCSRRS